MTRTSMFFVLSGALAGATIRLGNHQFVDGRTEVVATPGDISKIAHHLAINWQAFPEGDARIQEVNDGFHTVHGSTRGNIPNLPDNTGQPTTGQEAGDSQVTVGAEDNTGAVTSTDGDGHPQGLTNEKLRSAILGVDPEDDRLWTAGGQPTMKAVAGLYGSEGITRADVDDTFPGFTRDMARQLKAAADDV